MSEFLEQAGKLGMGGGIVNVAEHPVEELLHFGAGGAEAGEVLDVASLIAIQGGAEFEQDQALAADEADFEIPTILAGVEFLPEPGRKRGEIEAMEGGGSIQPIRIEPEFLGHLGGGVFHRVRQRVGANDIALPFPKRHHFHVLGLA